MERMVAVVVCAKPLEALAFALVAMGWLSVEPYGRHAGMGLPELALRGLGSSFLFMTYGGYLLTSPLVFTLCVRLGTRRRLTLSLLPAAWLCVHGALLIGGLFGSTASPALWHAWATAGIATFAIHWWLLGLRGAPFDPAPASP